MRALLTLIMRTCQSRAHHVREDDQQCPRKWKQSQQNARGPGTDVVRQDDICQIVYSCCVCKICDPCSDPNRIVYKRIEQNRIDVYRHCFINNETWIAALSMTNVNRYTKKILKSYFITFKVIPGSHHDLLSGVKNAMQSLEQRRTS